MRLSLAPAPLSDETLGSWLRRCATAYRHPNAKSLVDAVLTHAGHAESSREIDLDVAPSKELMGLLERCTELSREELDEMVVVEGLDVLRPKLRDAYCPHCLEDDLSKRAFQRRSWLHAWTLTCKLHDCLLWTYEPLDLAKPWHQATGLSGSEQIRIGLEKLGRLTHFAPSRLRFARSRERSTPERLQTINQGEWLDPGMCKSPIGRALILVVGSKFADQLHFQTFGEERPASFCWKDERGHVADWPHVLSCQAPLRVRLTAAYTAAIYWPECSKLTSPPSSVDEWLDLLAGILKTLSLDDA